MSTEVKHFTNNTKAMVRFNFWNRVLDDNGQPVYGTNKLETRDILSGETVVFPEWIQETEACVSSEDYCTIAKFDFLNGYYVMGKGNVNCLLLNESYIFNNADKYMYVLEDKS